MHSIQFQMEIVAFMWPLFLSLQLLPRDGGRRGPDVDVDDNDDDVPEAGWNSASRIRGRTSTELGRTSRILSWKKKNINNFLTNMRFDKLILKSSTYIDSSV